jgi:O-antigen/teichoic acid export membrane protein
VIIANYFKLNQRSDFFKKCLNNASWNSLGVLVIPLLWIITTPFFVKKLGTSQYGMWMLINSLIGFSGVFSFGLTDATIKFVAKYRILLNESKVVNVINTTIAVYMLIGSIICTCTYLLAPYLVNDIFPVESDQVLLAIKAMRIMGLGIIIRLVDEVMLALIQGYERYDLTAKTTIAINCFSTGSNLFLISRGFGLVEILLSTLLITTIGICVKVFMSNKYLLKNKRLKVLPTIDMELIQEMFSFGVYSWIQNLGGILFNQMDKFIIASKLGPSKLAYYVICVQVAQQVQVLLSKAFAFLFPFASAAYEQGDVERVRHVYLKSLRLLTVAAVGIGLPIFIFSGNLLSYWMGLNFSQQMSNILRLLVFSSTIMATSIVPYYYMNGFGLVRLNTIFALSSGTIVALVTFFMIPQFGILGAAMSRLAIVPFNIASRVIIHHKVLHDRGMFAGWIVLVPVFLSFSFAYTMMPNFYIVFTNIYYLLPVMAICAAVAAILTNAFLSKFSYNKLF